MGLFSSATMDQIASIAAKSNEVLTPQKVTSKSLVSDLESIEQEVIEYFKDSDAILITSKDQLHDYVTKCIEFGYAGIDTETTGLDRIHDHIVGASLYVPGMPECYIPMKHLVPIFDEPYKNQLSYEEVAEEFQRFVDNNTRLIFANVDFDVAMIYHDMVYKDLRVDLASVCYFDVILCWRCLKEDEKDNTLKGLFAKYPMKGNVDPRRFSDFFTAKNFKYCKPQVAKLYAGHDARITYELFEWELPYVTKTHPKCQNKHLEKIADLFWNVEMPMVRVCVNLHRAGMYVDQTVANKLRKRYDDELKAETAKLCSMVQKIIDDNDTPNNRRRPFKTGADFNPNSNKHVPYLLDLVGIDSSKGTGKEVLAEYVNTHPVIAQLLALRSLVTLIGTFVEKLPDAVAPDGRVHGTFKQVGAATGRMCIAEGTPVSLESTTKPIEQIQVGDFVQCYDEKTKTLMSRPVLNIWRTGENKECVKVVWSDINSDISEELICTPEHRLLTNTGWVRADELCKGHILVSGDSNISAAVRSVKFTDNHDVYDIEVADYHNFFAGGVCVHNSSAEPNLQNIPSKHEDIRHMFRATPEQDEIIEVEDTMKLFQCDKVQVMKDDHIAEWTSAYDLKVGDRLFGDSCVIIESISEVDRDGYITIKLREGDA